MMTKKIDKKRDQMMVFCMDDMVPQDHLLRLIKIPVIQYLFGIPVGTGRSTLGGRRP